MADSSNIKNRIARKSTSGYISKKKKKKKTIKTKLLFKSTFTILTLAMIKQNIPLILVNRLGGNIYLLKVINI
jgi:hypothetical protein